MGIIPFLNQDVHEERRSAFDSHGRLSVAGAKDGAKATDEVND